MKKLYWIVLVVVATTNILAGPKIILKLDDLSVRNNTITAKTILDYIVSKKIKCSFGIIASRLDNTAKSALTPYINATNTNGSPLLEFWNHGYDHIDPEFGGQPYQYQKTHFDNADKLVRDLLGIQMHSFGAPFNATDDNTLKVISENANYKVSMFGRNPAANAGFINLGNRVNLETSTGNPSFTAFQQNYINKKSTYTDYMVIQAHPNGWTSTKMNEFIKMLTFLTNEGCEFVTPYEYYLSLYPTTNRNPIVSLTSPTNGSSFVAPASISLAASANDADGSISKIEFYNGTTLLNIDATAPFAFTWSGVAAGSYSITAKAYDNAGATKTSAAVSISISATTTNQVPSITLTSPTNGSSFVAPASIPIAASANDADGSISKVEFYNGTTLLNIDATAPFAFTWSGVAAGSYNITAKAYDNAGATKIATAALISATNPSTGTLIGINGVSCATPGVLYSMTLNTEAGATSAGWWTNSDVTVTVDPADFKKATIKVNSASGSFVLTSGVNFSGSPYYKEYSKTIKIGGCSSRQLETTICPYPATAESIVKTEDGSAILELRILNTKGQVLVTQQYSGESEVLFQPELSTGMYILQIHTSDGWLNRPYLKTE